MFFIQSHKMCCILRFSLKRFSATPVFSQSDGYLRSIFAAKRITVHSVTSNTLHDAQDAYLCSLSLHTVRNCAKIIWIGLFPYGPFFISIFLYKEVFRYESFK